MRLPCGKPRKFKNLNRLAQGRHLHVRPHVHVAFHGMHDVGAGGVVGIVTSVAAVGMSFMFDMS
jgi:hypothetical protein